MDKDLNKGLFFDLFRPKLTDLHHSRSSIPYVLIPNLSFNIL